MWSLFNASQIEKIITEVCEACSDVTLWQSSSQNLYQHKGIISTIKDGKCILEISSEFQPEMINSDEPIYSHCEKRDVIFKRDKFTCDGQTITFKLPSEVMLKERRRLERFTFCYQDFKDVSYFWLKEDDSQVKFSHTLIDLSIAGLGFVAPQDIAENLAIGDYVYITNITDQELEVRPLKSQIKSIEPYTVASTRAFSHTESNQVRIGVEFCMAIDSVQYQSVQSLVKRTQKSMAGLQIEGFNGLTDVEQQRIINKAGEDNQRLAAQVSEQCEDIDRLRYMTPEMKKILWTEISKELLATSLRMATKELIYILLSDVTENIRDEFLEELNRPKPLSAIAKSQKSICDYIHQREKEGRFVLDPKSYVKYV